MDFETPPIEIYEPAEPYAGPERRRTARRGASHGSHSPAPDERRRKERRHTEFIAPTPREELLEIARTVLYKRHLR